ncbi:Uncharacterised protein [Candidatus Tiddalikarchaeum anstoanum]|nr:Uncharacterised protein [Candidatus Tiddalikarchaeum anstoanum]
MIYDKEGLEKAISCFVQKNSLSIKYDENSFNSRDSYIISQNSKVILEVALPITELFNENAYCSCNLCHYKKPVQ